MQFRSLPACLAPSFPDLPTWYPGWRCWLLLSGFCLLCTVTTLVINSNPMLTKIQTYTEWFLMAVGAVAIILGLLWVDGSLNVLPFVEDDTQKRLTATTTVEFNLEGIDKQDELKKRIQVMIDKTRAQQKKEEAQQELEKLQRKQTSLE